MSIPATESVSTGMYLPTDPTATTAGAQDKQMFLELIVAQLRYQDPIDPTDSSEFLAQSAQFTALEKMQDVADRTQYAPQLADRVRREGDGRPGGDVHRRRRHASARHRRSASPSAPRPVSDIDDTSLPLSQIPSRSAPPRRPARPTPHLTPSSKRNIMLRSLFSGITACAPTSVCSTSPATTSPTPTPSASRAATTVFQDTLSQMLTGAVRRQRRRRRHQPRSRSASACSSPAPARTSPRARPRSPGAPPT